MATTIVAPIAPAVKTRHERREDGHADYDRRKTQAIELASTGQCRISADGKAFACISQHDSATIYTGQPPVLSDQINALHNCTCPDGRGGAQICKHQIASGMMERASHMVAAMCAKHNISAANLADRLTSALCSGVPNDMRDRLQICMWAATHMADNEREGKPLLIELISLGDARDPRVGKLTGIIEDGEWREPKSTELAAAIRWLNGQGYRFVTGHYGTGNAPEPGSLRSYSRLYARI